MSLLTTATNNDLAALFAWQPAVKSMFEVSIVADGTAANEYTRLHATAITFAGAKLTLKRNATTRLFSMEKYNRADDVAITWRESSEFSVRDFHHNWLSKFYNADKDEYQSYVDPNDAKKALYKTLKVTLQNDHSITLTEILPTSIPDLAMSWANDNIIEYTLTYKVSSWSWE